MRSLSKLNSRRLVIAIAASLISCLGLAVAGPKEAQKEFFMKRVLYHLS